VPEFTEFAQARQAHLRRMAFLLCGNWHDAQDVAQIALMNLCRSWNRARRADSIDAYAHRVVVRAYLSQRRKVLRQQMRAQEYALALERVSGPDSGASQPELRLALLAALAQLAPRARAVVVLRFWEDLSVEATAEALGCSAGTVKSQTSRALSKLRAILGDSFFDEDEGDRGPERDGGHGRADTVDHNHRGGGDRLRTHEARRVATSRSGSSPRLRLAWETDDRS
jgi:RNA polymerase sigma-70 factor (sigma-E family)